MATGNWQLATPYPSASYTEESPDPCALTYGPAWVDTPYSGSFNPNDGKSQYISPFSDGPSTLGGWYVYRTAVAVPPATTTYTKYRLAITGQIVADDFASAIVLEDRTGCKVKALPSPQNVPGQNSTSWNPFALRALVDPGQILYIHAVIFNVGVAPQNFSEFRLEFISASFTPTS